MLSASAMREEIVKLIVCVEICNLSVAQSDNGALEGGFVCSLFSVAIPAWLSEPSLGYCTRRIAHPGRNVWRPPVHRDRGQKALD